MSTICGEYVGMILYVIMFHSIQITRKDPVKNFAYLSLKVNTKQVIVIHCTLVRLYLQHIRNKYLLEMPNASP